MGQTLRREDKKRVSLVTSKTTNNLLWFVNDAIPALVILGYLSKYQKKHGVIIYAFVIMGNHYHIVASFPNQNRAAFFRDFNSIVGKLATVHITEYQGGKFFRARYAEQALPLVVDLEDKVYYCALQAVKSGLCDKISDYPGYNSFYDATHGIKREYEVVNWTKYNKARKRRRDVSIRDFTETFELEYTRIPGCEEMSHKDYVLKTEKELAERREKVIKERVDSGKTKFMGREALLRQKPGAAPHKSKTSTRDSYRPLAISRESSEVAKFIDEHFADVDIYKQASKAYRAGDKEAKFPPGTYKPVGPYVPL